MAYSSKDLRRGVAERDAAGNMADLEASPSHNRRGNRNRVRFRGIVFRSRSNPGPEYRPSV